MSMRIHKPSAFGASNPDSYRFLEGGVIVLILLVSIAAWLTLAQMHQQAENRAIVSTQNLAKSLEQTFNGLIDTIDVALLASSKEI